jgi:hypothetical protein
MVLLMSEDAAHRGVEQLTGFKEEEDEDQRAKYT